MTRTAISSLARIADFDSNPYDVKKIAYEHWATGDYVVGALTRKPSDIFCIEDPSGEMVPVQSGDHVIGAFGVRAATLENVGSWAGILDGKMRAMTSAGLFGAITSESRFIPKAASFDYVGHIVRAGSKVCMADFSMHCDFRTFSIPTILLVGTSMSAGKTLTGRLACKVLSRAGYNVVGAKLTGAGRYKDIISFREAGAREIFDFVDAGMPSTIVPETEYRAAIRPLLHHIDSLAPDILVAEAGASPLEPYNGAAAIDELNGKIACTILCASDPYAVVGVMKAFGLNPDLVTGPATNTSAAIDLVERLTGVPGIDIIEPRNEGVFRNFLANQLKLPFPET